MTGVSRHLYRIAGVEALFALLAIVGAVVDLSFQVSDPRHCPLAKCSGLLVGLSPSHC